MTGQATGTGGSAERVADLLRVEIAEGRLASGTPLRESALSERIGVSRNTLREGLRLLGAAGLVEFGLYRGANVRTLGSNDIGDIYVVRRTLELRSIEHAHVEQADLDRMADVLESADVHREAGDLIALTTDGLRFHEVLVDLLRSPQLNQLFGNVVAQLRLLFSQAPEAEAFQAPWLARDREVLDLMTQGRRPQAVRALSVYLDDSERAVMDFLRARRYADDASATQRRSRT